VSKDFSEIADDLNAKIAVLKDGLPDTMAAFGDVGKATYRDTILSAKTKELIALAIGITDRCDGCIAFHARAALRRGATREEVLETIGVAIQMGGGPSMVYGAEALAAYDAFADERAKRRANT
jgi:AhpD family alkylhydroperoxidase